jgi:hypothetical protein
MFTVGTKVQVVRDTADGWGLSADVICQVVKVHPDRPVFWITPLKADGTLGRDIFWIDETDLKIFEEKKMTLGAMFKDIARKEEEAKVEAFRKEEEAKARVRAKRRQERENLMNAIEEEIVDKIKAGEKPFYRVFMTDQCAEWINLCDFYPTQPVEDRDRYDATAEWLKAEGLRLKITEAHDYLGFQHWLEITVKALPDPEDEAD